MRYLMLVMSTPEDPELRPGDAEGAPPIEAWVERYYGSGAAVLGDRLRPPQDAVGVRVRGGRVLVTDGPFSEAKEMIAGFDVIDAPDLDTAITMASEHPMAHGGAIELRPFWPLGLDDAPDGARDGARDDGGA